MSVPTREDVISALLDRIRVQVDGFDVEVLRHYSDAFETASAVYVGEVSGPVEIYGAAASPFRWRDVFTISIAVQLADPDLDPDSLAALAGVVVDAVVFAVSNLWDPNDTRMRYVEAGTDGPIDIDGPAPVHYTPKNRWMAIATLDVTLARYLYPTIEEATP